MMTFTNQTHVLVLVRVHGRVFKISIHIIIVQFFVHYFGLSFIRQSVVELHVNSAQASKPGFW